MTPVPITSPVPQRGAGRRASWLPCPDVTGGRECVSASCLPHRRACHWDTGAFPRGELGRFRATPPEYPPPDAVRRGPGYRGP